MISAIDLVGKEVEMGVERRGQTEVPCVMMDCGETTDIRCLWYMHYPWVEGSKAAWIPLCHLHRPAFADILDAPEPKEVEDAQ